MNIFTITLLIAWAVTFAALVWYAYLLYQARVHLAIEVDDHATCHKQIEALVRQGLAISERRVLHDAAKAYDDPATQPLLARLADEKYRPGGASVPALFLRHRGDELAGYDPDTEVPIYHFAGERVR